MRGKIAVYLILILFILVTYLASSDAGRKNLKKQCINPRRTHCNKNQFTCKNNRCVSKDYYCNQRNECGDNSDEEYCGRNNRPECPTNPPFTRCESSNKCIPDEWICDGKNDCPSGEDEKNCGTTLKERTVKEKAIHWMYNRSLNDSTGLRWDSYIHKAAVALFLAEPFSNVSAFQLNFAKDVSIQFLSRLAQKHLRDVPSTDLAAYVNAMLVTCLNPRRFHGMNLIEELRGRVNKQSYTNPYIILTLCNAGDTITVADKRKLAETFRSNHREFWTDMKAMVLLALSCVAKQPGNSVDKEMMEEFTADLKSHQYRNGSVENIQTTALVLQALESVGAGEDPENFDEEKALLRILASQEPDGSFGSFMETYYVLPVLNCRSLANITAHHCKSTETDKDIGKALRDLANRVGPKIRVHYSLWFGDQKDMERTMALRVPANMSLYNIMEIAAEIDEIYSFEYLVKHRKPYINGIAKQLDDPETGKFWFLYTMKNGEPLPVQRSPADVIPKDKDHFLMWYRSGSWTD